MTQRSEQQDVLWIFLHVPKTGGTTFNAHLHGELRWDEEFVHLGPWGDTYRRTHGLRAWEDRSVQERGRTRVIAGHRAYVGVHSLSPRPVSRYITFLRDPAERIVSAYHYYVRNEENPPPFEDWYAGQLDNMMVRYLSHVANGRHSTRGLGKVARAELSFAKDVLDHCWLVGFTENLDSVLAYLFDQIGVSTQWRNYRVTGDRASSGSLIWLGMPDGRAPQRRFTLDEATRTRLYRENALDVELVEYARGRWAGWSAPAHLDRGG